MMKIMFMTERCPKLIAAPDTKGGVYVGTLMPCLIRFIVIIGPDSFHQSQTPGGPGKNYIKYKCNKNVDGSRSRAPVSPSLNQLN